MKQGDTMSQLGKYLVKLIVGELGTSHLPPRMYLAIFPVNENFHSKFVYNV